MWLLLLNGALWLRLSISITGRSGHKPCLTQQAKGITSCSQLSFSERQSYTGDRIQAIVHRRQQAADVDAQLGLYYDTADK